MIEQNFDKVSRHLNIVSNKSHIQKKGREISPTKVYFPSCSLGGTVFIINNKIQCCGLTLRGRQRWREFVQIPYSWKFSRLITLTWTTRPCTASRYYNSRQQFPWFKVDPQKQRNVIPLTLSRYRVVVYIEVIICMN